MLKVLRKIAFFDDFQDEDLHLLAPLARLIKYKDGREIIEQDSINFNLYFLLIGKVNIYVDKKLVISIDRIGEIFGEMGIVNHTTSSASVKADGECGMLVFNFDDFKRFSEEKHSSLYLNLYKACANVLAQKLRSTNEIAKSYAQKLQETRQFHLSDADFEA